MVTRSFDFEAASGLRLSGRLELPDAEARGWALFAHCFTCGKEALAAVRISRTLASAGIGVLRFDFAGIGGSEGEFADTTFSTNVGDLVAAGEAMAAAGMGPDLLIGHSFGGAAVLAAASDLPTVRAIATIAAPFDLAHVLAQFDSGRLDEIRARGEAEVQLAGRPFRVRQAFVDDVRADMQSERIAHLRRPLLILHAPRDQVVGIEHATRIFTAAKHPKSYISLDGADHLLTSKADAEYVGGVIAAWAARYLRPIVEKRSMGQEGDVIAEETRAGRFQVTVRAGGIHFHADEPESVGGLGSGPTPYDLLSAALAACTTMTMRLYVEQKGWPVERLRTAVGHLKEPASDRPDLFARKISFDGDLDEAQRARLLEIAGRCPVHRTLERGSRIDTRLGDPPAPADAVDEHARDMMQSTGAR
jgi:putative redox protein